MTSESMFEDPELLEEFVTEAEELMEGLTGDLVALESDPSNQELLNSIFRAVHTIKGTSGFLGFDKMVKLSHRTEDVLNKLRKGEEKLTSEIMDILLKAVDNINLLIGGVRSGSSEETDLGDILQQLEGCFQQRGEEIKSPDRSDSSPLKPNDKDEKTEEVKKEPSEGKKAAGKGAEADDSHATIRLDVGKLDELMNLVGELVLERNRLLQLNRSLKQEIDLDVFEEHLSKMSTQLNHVTNELQTSVLSIRMFPIGKVFKKFPRLVRDTARELKKEVELHISGEETELDKSVVDEIGDPLVHLLRNSMDHGIELPEEREKRGKPRKGNIHLAASHEGNHIIIKISDDGKGIDLSKIKAKALEKGLLTEEKISSMGEEELLELIFLPGFSAAESVSNISGRGVGMDVVRTKIKKLKGTIEFRNRFGAGCEIILKLPLTLAIIQSLLVRVGEETLAIPLSSVLETVMIDTDQINSISGEEVLSLRNRVIPLKRLHKLYDHQAEETDAGRLFVVVIGIAEKRIGLIVDKLIGQEEVVIKSVGDYLGGVEGIAGATILGDGRVTLILDTSNLPSMNGHRRARANKSGQWDLAGVQAGVG